MKRKREILRKSKDGTCIELTREGARRFFSRATKRWFGVDGDTWVCNYVHGQYRDLEKADDDKYMRIFMLLPFWTPKGWRKPRAT